MKNKPQDLIVCNHFKLVKKLGTGAFGQIYLAQNKNNPNEKYAAKLQQVTSKFPQLHFQAKMYKYLAAATNVVGIPKVHAVTTEGQYNVMLMDLLGLSIQDIFVNNNKLMSLKSALIVGYQMVQRIKYLHERQIIHRDIKPDNFLMGTGKNSHILYIVDFGLSKKYIKDNKHIPYKEGKDLTGTARYASINTHLGVQQSRRDDLQSIGYVIMYLLRGILPWQNMNAKDTKTKYKLIMEKKKSTPPEVLCKGFPDQLATFINYTRQLKFEDEPNYQYLLGLLKTAMKNSNIEMDYNYDWTQKQIKVTEKIEVKIESTKEVEKQKQVQKDKQRQKLKTYNPRQVVKTKQQKPKQEQIPKQNPIKQKPKIPLTENKQSQMSRTKANTYNKSSNVNTSVNQADINKLKMSVGNAPKIGEKLVQPKISVVKR